MLPTFGEKFGLGGITTNHDCSVPPHQNCGLRCLIVRSVERGA